MKTAEDLTKDFVAGFMSAHTEDYVINSIKQIQLDAMKEGARRAAKEAAIYMGNTVHESRSAQYILTTAEQWTEKDL